MTMTPQEQKINQMMVKLGISREEAIELMEDDKRIDKGEKLFELTAEQEKASKQARQADRKPTVYKLDNENGKRSKKVDEDKEFLSNTLFNAILPICDTYKVVNVGREFEFTYHGRKFKVVLSSPRS